MSKDDRSPTEMMSKVGPSHAEMMPGNSSDFGCITYTNGAKQFAKS